MKKKGTPVSSGVAIAPAYLLDEPAGAPLRQAAPGATDAEVERLKEAWRAARRDLDELIARVRGQVGEEEAAIFRGHRALLADTGLIARVRAAVHDRGLDARSALQGALHEYEELFTRLEDPYLRERLADVRDVIGRIQGHLARAHDRHALADVGPVIVLARTVLPSQVMAFDNLPVAGIATEQGGTTDHAAILARSLGIPAVTDLPGLLGEVQPGDLVVLDGREGILYSNPGPEEVAAYRILEREDVDLRESLVRNRDLEPVTADGVPLDLLANASAPADAALAARVGATGVGLYRTEFLFLGHASVPSEEDQVAAYRAVIDAAPNRAVTIRTLDLGGDKHVPYLGTPHQANPFLGLRSTRLAPVYPELFHTQLRAILRAAATGHVRLLFPMVTTLAEVRVLRRLVNRVRDELRGQGLPCGGDVPFGVMVEVPAAAVCIDDLLDEVDFVSIGSNDLIQCLMAADRDNPRVAIYCEPFHPAIYRVLARVIEACQRRGKPVTLCGEMAGRPRCLLPLVGMGLRRLSMSPVLVPPMKELIRRATLAAARAAAEAVQALKTPGEVLRYLTQATRAVWPEVRLLETRIPEDDADGLPAG